MQYDRRMRRVIAGVALLVPVLVCAIVLRCRGHGDGTRSAGRAAGATRPATANPTGPTARSLPRGAIAGTVRTEAGAPIAGARVCADGSADDMARAETAEHCADTDTSGRYAIRELRAADYEVVASARTYRPSRFREPPPRAEAALPLAPGQTLDRIDLVLATGGVQLTGTVEDINGGPIAHAKVSAQDVTDVSSPTVETDARGAFTLWTSPGAVDVRAEAEGYRAGTEAGGAPGEILVKLEPTSVLAGTVVDDATSAPIEGAFVDGGTAHDLTGPDGTFELVDLEPDRYVVSATTAHGAGSSGSVRVELGARVDGIVVRLRPALHIAGKVMIAGSPPRPCPEPSARFDDERSPGSFVRLVDGTLEAHGVPPGAYKVIAECAGYVAPPADEIVVADRDIDERLWLVSPGATIAGRVVTRSGTPVSSAEVSANDNAPVYTTRSDAQGRYAITGLRPGSYGMDAHLDGGWIVLDDRVDVAANTTVVHDIVLPESGSVHAVVVDTLGRPVARREIQLEDDNADRKTQLPFQVRAVTNAAGELLFPRVLVGRYRIHENAHAGDEQAPRFDVQAGRPTEVRLVLAAQTNTIGGIVVGPDGAPVGDAYVTLRDRQGAKVAEPRLTGPDGAFTFEGLETQPLFVSARDPIGRSAKQADVAPGSKVRLQLAPNASIEGTVSPVPADAKLVLSGNGTEDIVLETTPDRGGHFAFDDLLSGSYQLSASATIGHTTQHLVIASGEHKHVDLTIGTYRTVTTRVVEAGTQTPVAGLQVTLFLGKETTILELPATSDATGRLAFERVVPGDVQLAGIAWSDRGIIATGARAVVTAAATEVPPLVAYRADFERWSETGMELDLEEGYSRGIVVSVEPSSPAATAGIVRGDEITAIDGIEITGSLGVLQRVLLHGPPGKPIRLTRANGSTVSVTPIAHAPPARDR